MVVLHLGHFNSVISSIELQAGHIVGIFFIIHLPINIVSNIINNINKKINKSQVKSNNIYIKVNIIKIKDRKYTLPIYI